jgi:hypothetical protein
MFIDNRIIGVDDVIGDISATFTSTDALATSAADCDTFFFFFAAIGADDVTGALD